VTAVTPTVGKKKLSYVASAKKKGTVRGGSPDRSKVAGGGGSLQRRTNESTIEGRVQGLELGCYWGEKNAGLMRSFKQKALCRRFQKTLNTIGYSTKLGSEKRGKGGGGD